MDVSASVLKPLIDAFMQFLVGGKKIVDRKRAEKGLQEALEELWQINPNEDKIEAQLAIAKAAGIINSDLLNVEQRLAKFRGAVKKSAAKKKPAAKKSAAKKKATSKKKAAAKKK